MPDPDLQTYAGKSFAETSYLAQRDGHIEISDQTDVKIRLVKRVKPVYPEEAKDQRITGRVICRTKIDRPGKVVDVRV